MSQHGSAAVVGARYQDQCGLISYLKLHPLQDKSVCLFVGEQIYEKVLRRVWGSSLHDGVAFGKRGE